MLVSTTHQIFGKKPVRYLGVVSGEAVMGTNFIRDWMARVTDIIGGRSGTYESKLRDAKNVAIQEMIEMTQELGGNAILGANLFYVSISAKNTSMLMVTANGTAVILEPEKSNSQESLKEKLARGEISKEQYYEMKQLD